MEVPLLNLKAEYDVLRSEIDRAIADCLYRQQWILGAEVADFESKVGKYLGAKYCIGTSSGTEALLLALRALSIVRSGREFFERSERIIVPDFTFAATAEAVIRAGATPVLVDIDPKTYNLSPAAVEECLSELDAVVGMIPVHLYGSPADMDALMQVAGAFGLFVVEDVAQAFGGKWKGASLGTIGSVGAFSFFPSKLLGAYGDAGMICTEDHQISRILRMLTRHGGEDKYNIQHVGYNARLDTIQAAVLGVKLKYLDSAREKRRRIAQTYSNELGSLDEIVIPEDREHEFHQYTIRAASEEHRDALQAFLKGRGISSTVYYPKPLHSMKLFEHLAVVSGSLKNADLASRTVLSIPIDPSMNDLHLEAVCAAVKEFFTSRSTAGK